MWGLPQQTDWTAWEGMAPEFRVGAGARGDVVVLPGHETAERARFGLAGLVAQTHPFGWQSAFDAPPQGSVRMVLVPYEAGAPNVHHTPKKTSAEPVVASLDPVVVVDHHEKRFAMFATRDPTPLFQALEAPHTPAAPTTAALNPAVSDEEHAHRIERAREHILAGDIYQANLSRQLDIQGDCDDWQLFTRLCSQNPTAHNAFVRSPEFTLVSNSMETLLRYDPQSRQAASWPIKGTKAAASDKHLASDEKERAEHIMIVDLVRNDLGRVCAPGSVTVPEFMHSKPYRGVVHGVSQVTGVLEENQTPSALVRSLFPGGSITGTPKRRAVQIIEELEQSPRGYYTGSLATVMPTGDISMSILIRSMVHDAGGRHVHVGGGIVADSHPEREITETWEKMDVFREALR